MTKRSVDKILGFYSSSLLGVVLKILLLSDYSIPTLNPHSPTQLTNSSHIGLKCLEFRFGFEFFDDTVFLGDARVEL